MVAELNADVNVALKYEIHAQVAKFVAMATRRSTSINA